MNKQYAPSHKGYWYSLFTLLLLLFMLRPLQAQSTNTNHREIGKPFLTAFNSKQYGGHSESWDFVQDQRGMMYVANTSGLLEYDGVSWRMIENANKSLVRSLDADENGRVYLGCTGEFGYLGADSTGQKRYVSLMDFIPPESREFTYVFSTNVTPDGVYFTTFEHLFRLSPAGDTWEAKVWESQNLFAYSFYLKDTLFVRLDGVGLMKMIDDSLHLLEGGEQFANDRVQVMLPFEYNDSSGEIETLLIGAFSTGLFIYDGASIKPFQTELDDFLKTNIIYKGDRLTDGSFAFATLDGGLAIMDRQGKTQQVINRDTGLSSNAILAVFVDNRGLLWLAPENAIVQVEYPSPLSVFDVKSGLIGGILDMVRHKGVLYVATGNGVFYLDPLSSAFKSVEGLPPGNPQSFSMLSSEDILLVGRQVALVQIEGTVAKAIRKNPGSLSWIPQAMVRSQEDPNLFYIGLHDGLTTMRWKPQTGTWVDEGRIAEEINESILTMVAPEPGILWLGTESKGTIRVTFKEHSLQSSKVEKFGSRHGFPHDGSITVFAAFGQTIFGTSEGAYRYNEARNYFYPDTLLNQIPFSGSKLGVHSVIEDASGNVWIDFGLEKAVARLQPDGTYHLDKTPLLRFKDFGNTTIYPDPDDENVIWFGGAEGLIRYDNNVDKNYFADYPTVIRQVIVGGDSLIYGGASSDMTKNNGARLNYENNALRFEYAATSYEAAGQNEYQTMLEGFDKRWSAWSLDTRKDYTNIPEGSYRFHVRARNTYQHPGQTEIYAFTIRPPWYRSWWAYAAYFIVFVGLIFGSGKVRSRQLESRNRALEQTIAERTAEVRRQAEETRAQKENIEQISRISIKNMTADSLAIHIGDTIYENINSLMDAEIFGVAIHNAEKDQLDFPAVKEKGKSLPPTSMPLKDNDRPAVWSFNNRKEMIINDWDNEYKQYLTADLPAVEGEDSLSVIYLPLIHQDKIFGVITVQSFRRHAYSENHVDILRNLATFAAITLDNGEAYRKVDDAHKDLQTSFENVELLSRIGRDITANLSIKAIIDTAYENVNTLIDATVFGIGVYNEEKQILEFPATKEKGATLAPYTNTLSDENRPAVWCFENQKEIYSNDWGKDYKKYLKANLTAVEGEDAFSLLYLPLVLKDRKLGVITSQSFKKNAYTDYHVNILRNLATYTAIALDNADAYQKLGSTQKQLLAEEQAKRELLEAENERQTAELEGARDLQLSMLPKEMPDNPDYDIAAYMKTATEVGGDYYDFSNAEDGSLIVALGDATGHGINSGMVVTTMKSLFFSNVAKSETLSFFDDCNATFDQIFAGNLLMGLQLLRIKNRKFSITTAGIPPAYLYRARTKTVEEIFIKAMPLGAFPGFPYQQEEYELHLGDTILLASDGFAELFNDKEEMFGYDETKALFTKIAEKPSQTIIDELVKAGDKWANGRPNDDDVTFVVVKAK